MNAGHRAGVLFCGEIDNLNDLSQNGFLSRSEGMIKNVSQKHLNSGKNCLKLTSTQAGL